MPYDEKLATLLRKTFASSEFSDAAKLEEKKMFGGVGFLLHSNMCCGVWKESLILRLGVEVARHVLSEQHTRVFDITGRPMKGWAMVDPPGWQNQANLERWVSWAIEFVQTLPPK